MIKVNATGQICPTPIIMTKKALKEIETGQVEVSIDNAISAENIQKMCKEMGLSYEVKTEGEVFIITIEKTVQKAEEKKEEKGTVIVIDGDTMGKGDEALGKTLMKGFLYTFTEMENLPETIIFYNRGVFLAVEGSESVEDLKQLQERGVEILCCGACINFYGLQEKVKVGTITNMYNIIEKQMKGEKIIKP